MITAYRRRSANWFACLLGIALVVILVACQGASAAQTPATPAANSASAASPGSATPTSRPVATAIAETQAQPLVAAPTSTPESTPLPTATSTPLPPLTITPGPAGKCGILLPVVPAPTDPSTTALDTSLSLAAFPEEVRPAVARILSSPETVGLVAYRLGEESEGIYLNADADMPLASVVKIIHLLAYADAVTNGQLDPATLVPIPDIAAYYLPNSDLDAHPAALQALEAEGRLFGDPPAVRLEDVPRMMIQYSSNAATDYLHMLLGQERIEQTAIDLGLTHQAAPCPFIGQFLLMGDSSQLDVLIADPRIYGIEVMNQTASFAEDPALRASIGGWRGRSQRPSLSLQELFAEELNTRGSAGDYAGLMARIANNELGSWEKMVLIRRYLEWPTFFPVNQEQMAWLGYKGGSLPGVLTSAYYAQPWWRTQPVVIALFFRDLPGSTYREWRRNQAHDELARWLMREPDAIPLLKTVLASEP